jgi:hypothetical protein
MPGYASPATHRAPGAVLALPRRAKQAVNRRLGLRCFEPNTRHRRLKAPESGAFVYPAWAVGGT